MSISVRAARPGDEPTYARLFPELDLGEPVPPHETIATMIPTMAIAEITSTGAPVGFLVTDTQGDDGFIRQIVADPGVRRRGIGAALMEHARLGFTQKGARAMRLNVIQTNTPALALYRAFGFRVDFDSVALWAPPRVVEALPKSQTMLRCFQPTIFEDEALERRWSIPSGVLALCRRKECPPIVVRDDRQKLRGLMCYSSTWNGGRPFCADSLEVVRALIIEMIRRNPTAPQYGIVIERDLTHLPALVAAGATVRFHMHQLIAPVLKSR